MNQLLIQLHLILQNVFPLPHFFTVKYFLYVVLFHIVKPPQSFKKHYCIWASKFLRTSTNSSYTKEGARNDEGLDPKRTRSGNEAQSGNQNLELNMTAIFGVLKGQEGNLFCITPENEPRLHDGHYWKTCQILGLDKKWISQIGEFLITRCIQAEPRWPTRWKVTKV